MADTIVIGGMPLTNYDASRMAKALREQRLTMTEEEIIENTMFFLPRRGNERERALEIIRDLDEKVNNRGV